MTECPACSGPVAADSLHSHLRQWHLGAPASHCCAECGFTARTLGETLGHALLEGHALTGAERGRTRAQKPVLFLLNAKISSESDNTLASTVSCEEVDSSPQAKAQITVLELSDGTKGAALERAGAENAGNAVPSLPVTDDSILVEKISTNPVAKDSRPAVKEEQKQSETVGKVKGRGLHIQKCAQCSSSLRFNARIYQHWQTHAIRHALGCREVKAFACPSCDYRSMSAKYVQKHISRLHPYDQPRPIARLVDKEHNEAKAREALRACFPDADIAFSEFR